VLFPGRESRHGIGKRSFAVFLCLLLFYFAKVALAGEPEKGKGPYPDQIDRIVALLPSPPDFRDVRDLFLHYALTVKSATVARETEQDAITVQVDFFLPVPPHCHPSEKERIQYYLEEAVWTKSENSDSFVPVNRWARHISDNESDWFTNISCYP